MQAPSTDFPDAPQKPVSSAQASEQLGRQAARPRRTNADMSSETQARILQATIESLAEVGYAGTTMSGIAERIGVSRAALIYHFNSKNALMAAVINAIYDEMATLYRGAAHPALTPAERMLAVLDVSFQFTHSISQMAHIELLLAARRDASFRLEVAPMIELRDKGFRQAWHQLITELGGNSDRLELVRDFAVSVFRGITITRSLSSDEDSSERQYVLLRRLMQESL
jgi:AcrR family transcriptional regulator